MTATNDYKTIEGTEPSPDAPHEARTIEHTRVADDEVETVHMMTEIEDGVFVAWSHCRACSKPVKVCSCKEGPVMPDYIGKWRDQRFDRSVRHRKPSETKKIGVDLDAAIDAVKEAKKQGVEPFDPDAPGFDATEEEKQELLEALPEVTGDGS